MTIEITIRNEAGEVVAYKTGDALRPLQHKQPPDKPLVETKLLVGDEQAVWSLYGFTVQPMIVRELRRGKS